MHCNLIDFLHLFQIGIIGGSGLNNPDILEGAKEISVDTPFGAPSDCLIVGKISGVDCVLLARYVTVSMVSLKKLYVG